MTARDVRIKCKIYGDTLGYVENKQLHVATIERAMDTYARQEAIEFQNWIRDNTVADGAPKLLHTTGRKTTEELYDLYLTYKNKTDG